MTQKEKEEIKDEIGHILVRNNLFIGNSEAAQLLREMADQWDD